MRVAEVKESERSIEHLKRQIAGTEVAELRQVFYGIISERTKNALLANVSDEFALRTVDPPSLPDRPARPRRLLVAALAAVLGVILCLRLDPRAIRAAPLPAVGLSKNRDPCGKFDVHLRDIGGGAVVAFGMKGIAFGGTFLLSIVAARTLGAKLAGLLLPLAHDRDRRLDARAARCRKAAGAPRRRIPRGSGRGLRSAVSRLPSDGHRRARIRRRRARNQPRRGLARHARLRRGGPRPGARASWPGRFRA